MTRRKIVLRSLFLLLIPAAFGLFESLRGGDFYNGGSYALPLFLWISLEVAVLLILSLITFIQALLARSKHEPLDEENTKEKEYLYLRRIAASYLLSAGLVLLVGASLCYGGVAVISYLK